MTTKKQQSNILIEKGWRDRLDQFAHLKSLQEKKNLSFGDLARQAIWETFRDVLEMSEAEFEELWSSVRKEREELQKQGCDDFE